MEQAKLNNEKERLCLYKLVIFGPSRVGKSSLFQVLLDKTPKEILESTGIYKLQMFKVAITKTTTLQWHGIELEDEITRLRFMLVNKIDKQEPKSAQKPNSAGDDASKPSEQLEVEKIICENVDQPIKGIVKVNTLMMCYDSGGQSEFFDVMPLLASSPTGYIMVLDINKKLDEPIRGEAKIEGKVCSSPDEVASIDMMKNAIASIQSCSDYTSHNNLLVVGTHLDKCRDPKQDVTQLDKQVTKKLVESGAGTLFRKRQEQEDIDIQTILTRYVHPVANFIKSETIDDINIKQVTKGSIQEIYTAVEKMSKNKELQEEISINSLLLLLQIQLKLREPPYYIAKIEYSKYAENCKIDQENVDEFLEYFHKLGFICYFKEDVKDVVFSPQWLFNRLSDVIFEKYNPNSLEKDDIEKGKIKKDNFDTIFKPETDHRGTKIDEGIEHLHKIFVGQNIMADEGEYYFMPALLSPGLLNEESFKTQLQTDIQRCFGKKSYETLYVEFKNHYFPRVIFCYLATQFLQNRWELLPEPRYNNVLVFQVGGSDQYLGLFDYKTKLAAEIYIKEDKNLDKKPHEICHFLYEFITKGCKQIRIDCKFTFGFTCKKELSSNESKKCDFFAVVDLQFPYLAKKYYHNCKFSPLKLMIMN